MNIETVKTSEIIPYEFNNRKHDETQINRISNSINEFGFNQPIVIDENNVVLVGHGRLLAAKKLGLDQVPVLRRSGLTEAQRKVYRILDNKLQNDSTWNFENMELDLGFIEDNGIDLKGWGLEALKTPDFEPISADEQGQLDARAPDFVKCPSCEHIFDANENKTKT